MSRSRFKNSLSFRRGHLPLRTRLILTTVLVSGISLALAIGLLYWVEARSQEQAETANAEAKVAMIAASVKPAVLFSDRGAAERALQVISADDTAISADILLPDGGLFVGYQKAGETVSAMSSEMRMIKTQPIKSGEETIAQLVMRFDISRLAERQQFYFRIAAFVLAVSLVLSLFLAALFQRGLTIPLRDILSYLQRIRESGDYSARLHMRRKDEFGDLAAGIDHMVDSIEHRDADLKLNRQELQSLVEVRTHQLNQKAYYDSLTGLANRELLNDRIRAAVTSCARDETSMAILFLDMDRFKIINDSLGHAVGDRLLCGVAERLSYHVNGDETLARISGDEFAVVIPHLNHPEDAARVATEILDGLEAPIDIDGYPVHARVSIGIAVYPQDGKTGADLLKSADMAMYHAKENGRGNYSYYSAEMDDSSRARLQMETALRQSVENDLFSLVYQPKVDLKTRRLVGFEALIRCEHEELKSRSPEDYMNLADEIGLTIPIGEWTVRKIFRQMQKWEKAGLSGFSVAFNVTASQLLSGGLDQLLVHESRDSGISCNRIELEIVENVFLQYSNQVIDSLKNLRKLGAKIAVDDFGTGYSSMQYLRQFPLDCIKLDGSFIRNLNEDSTSAGIVTSMAMLAQSLKLNLVMEGVETASQVDFLASLNCDQVQGYYFSRPLPPERVNEALLNRAYLDALPKPVVLPYPDSSRQDGVS